MALPDLKNALIPYFTFADPSIPFTESLIIESFKAGADVVELGIPFSDPIADGPVIQASHQRVLENGDITIDQALKTVKKVKGVIDKPIIFMAAVNLIHHYNVETFFKQAAAHKLDGIIIPDLPVEEADKYVKAARQNNVDLIFLLSPLTEDKRFKMIVTKSRGFLYLISSTGTTGERKSVAKNLKSITKKIKTLSNIPVIVGFGVSEPKHLKEICTYAEGAIVGSHFVKMIEDNIKNPDKALKQIVARIKAFKS